VVVAGVVGTPVATGTTLVTIEIWAVMRHSKMSRGLRVDNSGGCCGREEDCREGVTSMEYKEFLFKNSWVRRWL
jgi:hypothetical protein